jgi:hypothetical protein
MIVEGTGVARHMGVATLVAEIARELAVGMGPRVQTSEELHDEPITEAYRGVALIGGISSRRERCGFVAAQPSEGTPRVAAQHP